MFALTLNRFASADVIVPEEGDPQALNRYTYTRNNPLVLIDTTGHCWGFARGIRNWNIGSYGMGTNCANIDMALTIVTHPDADPLERELAVDYLTLWGVAGVSGTAGIAGLACSTVALCAKVVESAAGIGGYACRDGDCGNEALLLRNTIQQGLSRIQNGSGQGYRSFRAFKNAQGTAGNGNAWHHIVNQNSTNISRFGAERIHNTNNLIKLPDSAGQIHRQLTGYYNSIDPATTGSTTLRVREWLATQSYEYQWQFGIDTIIRLGGQQYIIDQLGNLGS